MCPARDGFDKARTDVQKPLDRLCKGRDGLQRGKCQLRENVELLSYGVQEEGALQKQKEREGKSDSVS